MSHDVPLPYWLSPLDGRDDGDRRPSGQRPPSDDPRMQGLPGGPASSHSAPPTSWGAQRAGSTQPNESVHPQSDSRGGMRTPAEARTPDAASDSRVSAVGARRGADSAESALGGDTDLLAASKEEYDHVERELDEIRLLIKQSASELEKLNQRKVLASARTREMEEKIETFSRQEIRRSYLEASEAEMRAFMMGEQREQLQAKEQVFLRYQQYLRRTIEVLSAISYDRGAGLSASAGVLGGMAPQRTPAGSAVPLGDKIAALSRVIQAQEDVRQRVAQRLHDGPAQSLANVVLTAEICEKLVQSDPRRAQGELGNLKGLVSTTLQDTRKFIFELRPMTLDDLGLVPTLKRFITDVGAKYQVQVNLVAPQGDQRLPRPMEVPLFRVAQEALINAIQHGRATQVRVTLALSPEGAVMIVEDNGSGFDVEHALARAAAHETTGIASMQERAEMLGGWLRIESARGHGTRLELSVPGVAK